MAFKFKVGQAVRFIDCEENKFSPPHGTIGTVLKVGAIGIDYLVKFPDGTVTGLAYLPEGWNFWYHEDELEAVEDGWKEECAYTAMPNIERVCSQW